MVHILSQNILIEEEETVHLRLFKETLLLVRHCFGSVCVQTPSLPQSCPHVFLTQQRVKLAQSVQNLEKSNTRQ